MAGNIDRKWLNYNAVEGNVVVDHSVTSYPWFVGKMETQNYCKNLVEDSTFVMNYNTPLLRILNRY